MMDHAYVLDITETLLKHSYDVTHCLDRALLYKITVVRYKKSILALFTNPDDAVLFTLDTGINRGVDLANIRYY